jgi:endoglucanase
MSIKRPLVPPLSTSGARILNRDGTPTRLSGVNWGGGQQDECVPYGLDVLHRDEIAARIAGWGMNSVRLPFAVGGFVAPDGTPRTQPAPAGRLAANPDLAGAPPSEVFYAVAEACTRAGLYAIPNQHLLWPGWCCSGADANGLHWNDRWPAAAFQAAWKAIATRLAGNPLVGYDLHNEPRKAAIGGVVRNATWGDGNPQTDMRLLYHDTAAALRRIDPDALFFCEGLSYAADLRGWAAHPVGIGGAVASLHDYAWFHDPLPGQAGYEQAMDDRGGYLAVQGRVPLWIGEFGASTDVPEAAMRSGWLPRFIAWAARRGVSWCWWELSATAVLGTEPATNTVKVRAGQREAFSLMAGHDWRGTQTRLLDMLAPIM